MILLSHIADFYCTDVSVHSRDLFCHWLEFVLSEELHFMQRLLDNYFSDKPVRKKLPKKTPQAKRNVRYRHEDSGGGKALARYRSKSSAPWIRDDADEDLYIKRLR